ADGPVPPLAADVQVQVLGELAVRTPAGPAAAWGGQRTRTLFQYLLMHRRPVHREVLMELLWPGYTYSSARNNLNVCVYGLRRAISPDAAGARHIVYRDGCYSLNRDLRWDIDRDRFVDAAQRCRGIRRAAVRGRPGRRLVRPGAGRAAGDVLPGTGAAIRAVPGRGRPGRRPGGAGTAAAG